MTTSTTDLTETGPAKRSVISPIQVMAAREYIKRTDDPLSITDYMRMLAALDLDEVRRKYSEAPIDANRILAAQILVELQGEENVEPHVLALSRAKPEV